MSKSFAGSIKKAATGLSNLIPTTNTELTNNYLETNQEEKRVGRKPRTDKDNKTVPAAEKGTKPGEMRKTYLVAIELAEDLEAIAYWERETIKDVVNQALNDYVIKYATDSKNKLHVLPSLRIKPIPKK